MTFHDHNAIVSDIEVMDAIKAVPAHYEGETATPAETAATSQPAPSAPAPTVSPSSAAPSGATLSGGAAPAATAEMVSIREALKGSLGEGTVNQFQSDEALLQHLVLAAQQAQRYEQQLAQYIPHADKIRAWEAEQQKAEQARQAEQAKRWRPYGADWNPEWNHQVMRDPQTGQWTTTPGTPPDVLSKYLAGRQHMQNFVEKFAFDPVGAIQPGLEQLIEEKAAALIEQRMGGYQEQVSAREFVGQNTGWVHLRNPETGAIIPDQYGRPQLSQDGQALRYYLSEAEKFGIPGIEAQKQYAMGMVQRDWLWRQQQQTAQQQQAVNTGVQQKQQFTAAHNKPNVAVPPQPIGRDPSSLKKALMKNLEAEGFAANQQLT